MYILMAVKNDGTSKPQSFFMGAFTSWKKACEARDCARAALSEGFDVSVGGVLSMGCDVSDVLFKGGEGLEITVDQVCEDPCINVWRGDENIRTIRFEEQEENHE